jgi:hypothetical protein
MISRKPLLTLVLAALALFCGPRSYHPLFEADDDHATALSSSYQETKQRRLLRASCQSRNAAANYARSGPSIPTGAYPSFNAVACGSLLSLDCMLVV